jgi:hypothetical protein
MTTAPEPNLPDEVGLPRISEMGGRRRLIRRCHLTGPITVDVPMFTGGAKRPTRDAVRIRESTFRNCRLVAGHGVETMLFAAPPRWWQLRIRRDRLSVWDTCHFIVSGVPMLPIQMMGRATPNLASDE